MIREGFQQLLAKPVNRREFLGYIGVLALGVIGISSLLKSVSDISRNQTRQGLVKKHLTVNGYGQSAYGE